MILAPYNLIISILVSIFPIIWIYKYCRNENHLIYLLIYFVHFLIFCFAILFYINNFSSDVNGYMDYALNYNGLYKNKERILIWQPFSTGTSLIKTSTYFFYNYLYLSKFNIYLIYSSIGLFGFFIYLKNLNFNYGEKKIFKAIVYLLFLLLPSFHFFSSLVGKEGIFFLITALLIYSTKDFNNRKILFLLSLFLAFLIRPQVGLIMFISITPFYILQYLFNKNNSIYKITITILTLIILFELLCLRFFNLHFFEFVKIFKLILEQIISRADLADIGSSGIIISDYNFFQLLFNYLFGPSISSIKNYFYFIAAIEGIFLIILISLMISFINFKKITKIAIFRIFPLISYCFIFLIVMSYATSNLGIAIRQKWMILPVIIYILSYLDFKSNCIAFKKEERNF